MKKIGKLLTELERHIPHYELADATVSNGSVGWHIEHCLLVFNAIINALYQSKPADYRSTFSIPRSYVMLTGKIPRGKVKVPVAVQPAVKFNSGTLQQHIRLSEKKIKLIENLAQGRFFRHPFLGDFKLKPALRFFKIHTQHHLDIINDIIKVNIRVKDWSIIALL